MARVVWSPSFLDDLNRIAEYVARDSRVQASLLVLRIVETVERLQRFPKSGVR